MLRKHTKFRVQINENDEVACWDLICRQPYQDKFSIGIREKVVEFLESHSNAILD